LIRTGWRTKVCLSRWKKFQILSAINLKCSH